MNKHVQFCHLSDNKANCLKQKRQCLYFQEYALEKTGKCLLLLCEWQQWDHRFHLLIGQATRNPALISLMEVINGMRVKPDVREKTSAQETRSYFAAQHQEIVSAMKARDGEAAARCMREHLLSVQWRASAKSDEAALRHD